MRISTVVKSGVRMASLVHEFVAHPSAVTCVSLGSQLVASGGEDKRVNVWRVAERASNVWSLQGHTSAVTCVNFGANQDEVVCGSRGGSVRVFELGEGRCARALQGHRTSVNDVHQHPFGDFIASGGADSHVKIWDVRRKTCIQSYKGLGGEVEAVRFSPDGRWVASCARNDNELRLWDLTAGKQLAALAVSNERPAFATHLEFSPREFVLAAACSDKVVRLYDLEQFAPIAATPADPSNNVRALAFSPAGKSLAAATETGLRQLSKWDAKVPRLALFDNLGWTNVRVVALRDDNKCVAVCSASNFVTVFECDVEQDPRSDDDDDKDDQHRNKPGTPHIHVVRHNRRRPSSEESKQRRAVADEQRRPSSEESKRPSMDRPPRNDDPPASEESKRGPSSFERPGRRPSKRDELEEAKRASLPFGRASKQDEAESKRPSIERPPRTEDVTEVVARSPPKDHPQTATPESKEDVARSPPKDYPQAATPESKEEEPPKLDDTASLLTEVLFGRSTSRAIEARLEALRTAGKHWSSGDVATAFTSIRVACRDSTADVVETWTLAVDFLGAVDADSPSLDDALALLGLLHDLVADFAKRAKDDPLAQQHARRHVKLALDLVQRVLDLYGDVVQSTLAAGRAGVDLARDDRCAKCDAARTSLLAIADNLPSIRRDFKTHTSIDRLAVALDTHIRRRFVRAGGK